MSAIKQMRQMIDGLMGSCRNGRDESSTEKVHYSSSRVCKSFLLGCCPHEVLSQTRFDLGKCPKIHDVALKADFEKTRDYEHEYQIEVHEQLKLFLAESKRRLQVAKVRLAISQDVLNIEEGKKIDYIHQIDNTINETIKKVECLGATGNVEESLKLLKEVDELKNEKSKILTEFKTKTPASLGQQKKLRVCDICSSYLGLNDDDKRLADHFNGKLHLGFLYIREKYKELEDLIQDRCIKAILDSEFKSSRTLKRIQPDTLSSHNKYPRSDNKNILDSKYDDLSSKNLMKKSSNEEHMNVKLNHDRSEVVQK